MKRLRYSFVLLLIILIFSPEVSKSQEFMTFAQSNYAGVSGVFLQPASIADSRYRYDMVVFGANVLVGNNYVSLKREAFFKPSLWEADGFKENYLFENLNGKDKSGLIGATLLMPSFMVNISDKSAVAFSTKMRSMINIDNISEDFAKLAYEDFNYEPLLRKELTNANINLQTNTWAESALTFATVLANSGEHFVKGGATIKYLQGITSGYVFVSELNYRFDANDTLSLFQSKVNYGLSDNFDLENFDNFKLASKPGFGFDIGFVYEYRPGIEKFRYNMDGREGLLRPDKEKYLLKVGIALLDFGKINYSRSQYSQDFQVDIIDWDLSEFTPETIEELNDSLRKLFEFNENATESFNVRMPTALSIQIDYNFARNFYLNFSPYIALNKGTNITSKTHYYSSYSLTPRYDLKWFGIAVPLQADEFGRLRAGLSLRLGPVWIGSNSLITNSIANQIYGFDAYAMVKLPLFRKIKRDSDKDGVSNKLDLCPEKAGIWLMLGCPDTDGDGIADQKDECPNDPGPEALNGCPDRDGDGITDLNDRCPDHAGLPEFNGCPDSDGDGVVDFEDECPDQPGNAELRGCPDRDNDGIADKDDKCPEVPGKPEFQGCPFIDTDNDGIPDETDECPTIPGPAEFNGCPDSDGDGISDKYDLCPNIPGVPENKGCPPIQKEEIEIIKRAFSALEFESGKSIIKAISYPSLNELAELMKTQKMWKVQLSGHTDNTGNPEKNMELSKNRTQAVKDYLIKQGVEQFRIPTEWFGQELPVADNKTPAGRQKNRRVEMKIVFE